MRILAESNLCVMHLGSFRRIVSTCISQKQWPLCSNMGIVFKFAKCWQVWQVKFAKCWQVWVAEFEQGIQGNVILFPFCYCSEAAFNTLASLCLKEEWIVFRCLRGILPMNFLMFYWWYKFLKVVRLCLLLLKTLRLCSGLYNLMFVLFV